MKALGYAPGDYFCTCWDCRKQYSGDKRSWRCESCARKEKIHQDVRLRPPPVPMESAIPLEVPVTESPTSLLTPELTVSLRSFLTFQAADADFGLSALNEAHADLQQDYERIYSECAELKRQVEILMAERLHIIETTSALLAKYVPGFQGMLNEFGIDKEGGASVVAALLSERDNLRSHCDELAREIESLGFWNRQHKERLAAAEGKPKRQTARRKTN